MKCFSRNVDQNSCAPPSSNMTKLKPKLKFKEIAVDTNEKDRKRKEEDQRRWENYFHAIVVDYFENCTFESFYKEFDPRKDQLDVFVPSYGSFMCGKRNPGKRKGKNSIQAGNSLEQSGCGRSWNSCLTMTKFVCEVQGNDLLVTLRQFGQRCRKCSKKKTIYENPSFKINPVNEIVNFLLVSILDGIFDRTETHLYVDFDVLEGPRRRCRFIKKQINSNSKQTSIDDTQKYDECTNWVDAKTDGSDIGKHEVRNCEVCDKNKGCGKQRKGRRKKKKKVNQT